MRIGRTSHWSYKKLDSDGQSEFKKSPLLRKASARRLSEKGICCFETHDDNRRCGNVLRSWESDVSWLLEINQSRLSQDRNETNDLDTVDFHDAEKITTAMFEEAGIDIPMENIRRIRKRPFVPYSCTMNPLSSTKNSSFNRVLQRFGTLETILVFGLYI